ncbi:hypothetical protein ACWDOP_03280 [Nocardia sp. NPDC003693]
MPAATVYTCRVTNWPTLWMTIVSALVSILAALLIPGTWFGVLGTVLWVLAVAITMVQSSQRVSTGSAGVSVNLGILGVPRVVIARPDIAELESVHLTGWESSGLFWTPKRGWMLTPNEGPALRLRSTSGRRITVSVKDPAAAAWALGIAP